MAIEDAAAGAGAAVSTVDPIYGAAISAGGQLLGSLFGGKKSPKPAGSKTNPRPYAQETYARLFAIIDKYLTDRGIKDFIPKDRMPYELRSPEDQAQIREQYGNGSPGRYEPGRPPPVLIPETIEPEKVKEQPTSISTGLRPGAGDIGKGNYDTNARLAAQIGAKRMGITSDAPAFNQSREAYEGDQIAKQKDLEDTYNFIYGQRKFGRR